MSCVILKKYTSKKIIIQTIIEETRESQGMALAYFEKACAHLKRDQSYKVCFCHQLISGSWQDGYPLK
jgi:hypothetical protein